MACHLLPHIAVWLNFHSAARDVHCICNTADTDMGPYHGMHEAARYGTGHGIVSTHCYCTGWAIIAIYGSPIKVAKIKLITMMWPFSCTNDAVVRRLSSDFISLDSFPAFYSPWSQISSCLIYINYTLLNHFPLSVSGCFNLLSGSNQLLT